mgnify:CR=1 FL=1
MLVRVVTTGSKNLAVQVVYHVQSRTKVLKHLGTAHNEGELARLKRQAEVYIENNLGITPLFPEYSTSTRRQQTSSLLDSLEFSTSRHNLIYETLLSWYSHLGFDQLSHPLLRDLVIVRLVEPTSKFKSLEFMSRHFGVNYSPTKMYREIPKLSVHQGVAEQVAMTYATTHYNFSFALVFYDVSTLYFESFTESELQKCGFSKDHKHNQPQIMIGLLVNEYGFPITYNLFEGNTFEGHTILPVLKDLCARHQIKTLTVVADAGMLSKDNVDDIVKSGLSYIVGARLGKISLPKALNLHGFFHYNPSHDPFFMESTHLGTFVADYSVKRAKKDKRDRDKQIEKAKLKIHGSTATSSTKFVKVTKKAAYTLNAQLIEKAELMEGIKGYYTNLNLEFTDPKLVIDRYHDLWHVEKAFRMAKTDLLARPIYHYKKKSIETHLLIVFISLCLGRSLEIIAKLSLAKIISLLWEVEDITLIDSLTHDSYTKRSSKISNELTDLLTKLKTAY